MTLQSVLHPASGWPGRTAAALGLLAAGTAIAAGILINPLVAGGIVAVALVAGVGAGAPTRLPRLFLLLVAIVLVGYASLGREFARLGVRPVYIGEVILGIGVLATLWSGGFRRILRSPITWILLAFMAWGALRTVPFVDRYGVDALRDAVLWGYGFFALMVAACLGRPGAWQRVPALYAAWLPWMLLWLPLAYLASSVWAAAIPNVPGATMLLEDIKPGDIAVHLAGAAAFLLVGGYAGAENGGRSRLEWVWWGLWSAGVVLVATQNRGGMLAILVALAIPFVLRPSRKLLKIGFVVVLLASAALAVNFELDIGGRRSVSPRQLAANVLSMVQEQPAGGQLAGTREWRERWWGDIVDYTFYGPHFWTGKGYGVNLANADGYQTERDESLRSPHNGHLAILARSGVPGLVLWIVLQGAFAVSLIAAWWRARARGDTWWVRVNLWLLAYWTAFLVNASFDVYLEGPQGGIWFWCVFGAGLAAIEAQRSERSARRAVEAA